MSQAGLIGDLVGVWLIAYMYKHAYLWLHVIQNSVIAEERDTWH